jgi:hypothetical protein
MSYNLFLDDVRTPESAYYHTQYEPFLTRAWVVVRNYDEFVMQIEEYDMPILIAFDHDLSSEHYCHPDQYENYDEWEKLQNFKEKTGKDCANWLVEYCLDNDYDCPDFFVHSMNPVGKKNIESILNQFRKFQNVRD